MAVALGVLGLAPRTFWSMTPKELDAALRGRFGGAVSGQPPTRGDLLSLMQRYPDSPRG